LLKTNPRKPQKLLLANEAFVQPGNEVGQIHFAMVCFHPCLLFLHFSRTQSATEEGVLVQHLAWQLSYQLPVCASGTEKMPSAHGICWQRSLARFGECLLVVAWPNAVDQRTLF
jgi:hypothetical protein